MDRKDLDLIIDALHHAGRIIGLSATGSLCVNYEDFRDMEIRDMYYKINDMCLAIYRKRDGKECATCVHYDTDKMDHPCCTCHHCSNWEKKENNTADCG